MARFFIHLHECGSIVTDYEGLEAADLDEVIAKAARGARAVMAAEVTEGKLCLSCHVEVEDADHTVIARIPFRELIAITGL